MTDGLDPEVAEALRRMPRIDPSKRLYRALGRIGPRLMRVPAVDGVEVRAVRENDLHARVHRPAESSGQGGGLLWIHGGGYVIGAPKQDEALCAQTAARLGITVVSPVYRHAPESPFPAAHDDVTAAWHATRRNASALGIDPDRLVIGGESAGGGLAAGLVQRIRDEGGAQPIGQWLFAPMIDDRTAARDEFDDHDHPVWNAAANRYAWRAYLGHEPGRERVAAYAAPARRDDLSGLPTTWLCADADELFHDEVVDYASRLRAAGVATELEIVHGGAHGFENWANDTALAQRLLAKAHAWLGTVLAD